MSFPGTYTDTSTIMKLEATCPAPGVFQAVDVSEPVNQHFLDAMKQLKIKTVIRYFDHTNETLRGKTLKIPELTLIAKNGFDSAVVFQHNNNQLATFTETRGTSDAKRSLELAAGLAQPKGSSIYFGVDGDFPSAPVKAYFGKAAPLIRALGYKIGAYGSGQTCTLLLDAKLIDSCWLANAKGWAGYQKFLVSSRWVMAQEMPKNCGGINVDFNTVNTALESLGSFRGEVQK